AITAHGRLSDSDVPSWARDAPGGIHHVVKGDNLWDIAQAKLGDPFRWREIYVLNRGKPQFNGYALTDPDEIHIGWVLVLPARTPHPPAPSAPSESEHEHGVRLPSQGWVSLGLAATIAVAAALLRLQRRRRARLGYPIPVATRPQPAPVPASLTAVDAAGTRLLNLDGDDSALPGVLPAAPPVAAPVGVDAHGSEVSLFDLPGPGLALHGPGTEPAARA